MMISVEDAQALTTTTLFEKPFPISESFSSIKSHVCAQKCTSSLPPICMQLKTSSSRAWQVEIIGDEHEISQYFWGACRKY
jgi:hypothetical protein